MQFQFTFPTKVIFGYETIEEIGIQTSALGKKAMIVTGRSSRKNGVLTKVQEILKEQGVESVVFDEATANPLAETAELGARRCVEYGCDVVIGLGGGSMLDAAKGIAFLSGNEGPLEPYIFGAPAKGHALPLVLVPTTCGTGSEGNSFAVFTVSETHDKKSLRSMEIMPKVAIVDPALMESMPKHVLAAVGIDAFIHNMEAYISRNAQPVTDVLAVSGMKLALEALPRLYAGEGNREDWSNMALASLYGGTVIGAAGVILGHAMEHPVSGLYDAVHGEGLAALLPSILEATVNALPEEECEKLTTVARMLGGENAEDVASCFRKFAQSLGHNSTLSDIGVKEEDLDWLSENCFKVGSVSIAAHPAVFTAEEIREIYLKAL